MFQYWFEWRYRCRTKAANARRFQSGANRFIPISDLEIRVIELCGKGSVTTTNSFKVSSQLDSFIDEEEDSDSQPLENIKVKTALVKKSKPRMCRTGTSKAIEHHQLTGNFREIYYLTKCIQTNYHTQESLCVCIICTSETWKQKAIYDKYRPCTNLFCHRGCIHTKIRLFVFTITDHEPRSVTPPPKWALDIEERRLATEERMAAALESIASVMQSQEERRAMLDERIADAVTTIAGTVQDLNSGLQEALQHLHTMNSTHTNGPVFKGNFII